MDDDAVTVGGLRLSTQQALDLLREGELGEVEGQFNWGSNVALLLSVGDGSIEAPLVYKPQRGERPLWDFPDGTLCLREVAAFLVSEALGWGLVPPTVLREGPYGLGMMQLGIEADPEVHYFTLGPEFRPALQRLALFDHITNNADRKGGHCLVDGEGRLWSIDHGICFHEQPKLRTVIWDFAGQPIPAGLLPGLEALCVRVEGGGTLRGELGAYLSQPEIEALQARVRGLLDAGAYPEPGPGRNMPWPPV